MHVPLWRLLVCFSIHASQPDAQTPLLSSSLCDLGACLRSEECTSENKLPSPTHTYLSRQSPMHVIPSRPIASRRVYFQEQASQPDAHLPLASSVRAAPSPFILPPRACTHSCPGALRLWARHHRIVVKNVVAANTGFQRHALTCACTAQAKGSAWVRQWWLCDGHRRWLRQ